VATVHWVKFGITGRYRLRHRCCGSGGRFRIARALPREDGFEMPEGSA